MMMMASAVRRTPAAAKKPSTREEYAVALEETSRVTEERLQHSLRMLAEAEETGLSVLDNLGRQRESLESARRSVRQVHAELDDSEWILRGMSSWWGAVRNYFSTRPSERPTATRPGDSARRPLPASSGVPVRRVTPRAEETNDPRLRALEAATGRLHAQALAIGAALDEDAEVIDELSDLTDATRSRTARVTRKVQRLAR